MNYISSSHSLIIFHSKDNSKSITYNQAWSIGMGIGRIQENILKFSDGTLPLERLAVIPLAAEQSERQIFRGV